MARKQVLVQLDDDLVRRLDERAVQLSISRSELLRRAAIAVLDAYDAAAEDRWLVEAYRRQPQDPALIAAAAKLAAQTVPEW
jgi:metal-responsive CopG/Arc/MetJ family transcriptional regulator